MKILTELGDTQNLSLALGYFDGVHLGHRKVIESAVLHAKNNNNKSAVITFLQHPCCYLYGVKPKYILPKEKRLEYIQSLGIDYVYLLDFNSIKDLTGEDYIENILIKNFHPTSISTGFNHFFGAKKTGNPELLKKYSKIYGYKYYEVPPEKFNNEIISSTLIRNLIQDGNIENANLMLGHEFTVSGIVKEGNKLGRTIGFKTANISYPPDLIEIPYGCYSTETCLDGKTYKSITNFGVKPTVNNCKVPLAETHILDFDQDIYGAKIDVNFKFLIRKEIKFASLDELKTQIALDIEKINR